MVTTKFRILFSLGQSVLTERGSYGIPAYGYKYICFTVFCILCTVMYL